ncbi:MAG TPA: suppressor of fused domain protein [Nannocystis exedens]|nr:suppressor of fused domain protein [Nannocystis exedens]
MSEGQQGGEQVAADPDNEKPRGWAPGWAAIDAALTRLYPGQVPHQFASKTAYELATPSPLPAIAVYEVPPTVVAGCQHPAHWHYISYGLSELFDKTSPDPEISGFGFELTLRTSKKESESQPPAWGVRLLQALGRFVLSSGEGFDSGHRADLGGPLVPGIATDLRGIAIVPDPTLGRIHTDFGALLFLQVIGLHGDEVEAMAEMDYQRVVMMLSELDHFARTELDRPSWLGDPATVPTVRRYRLGIGLP